MKKEDGSLKSIERREKRIEKKTQWIFWIVIVILVILALFYLQSYYTNNNILTGKGTGEGGPGPGRNGLDIGIGDGSEDGGENSGEQARESAERATVISEKAIEFASSISEASTFSETEESLTEIKRIKKKVAGEFERTKALLDRRGLPKSTIANIIIRVEELEKILREIQDAENKVKEIIINKIKRIELAKKREERMQYLEIDLVSTIVPVKEELLVELLEFSYSVTEIQGLAIATFGGKGRPVEWTVEVEVSGPEKGQAIEEPIKVELGNKPIGGIRSLDSGSASIIYESDSRNLLKKLLGIGEATQQIVINGARIGETYTIFYDTPGPTITSIDIRSDNTLKVIVATDNEYHYEEVLTIISLDDLNPSWPLDPFESAIKVFWVTRNEFIDAEKSKIFVDPADGIKKAQFVFAEASENEFEINLDTVAMV